MKVILTGSGADEFAGGYSKQWGKERADWAGYLESYVRPSWARFSEREEDHFGSDPARQGRRNARRDYQHMMYMNHRSLQFYNLWHEDRTSSSQGIESRVPFLDHRLVELLLSVPPELHEELFWDKQIVRELIPALLPDYPADTPKVPFIYVAENESIVRLYHDILQRTFPDFLEVYGDSLRRQGVGRRARKRFRRVNARGLDAESDIYALMRLMQTEIFVAQCADCKLSPPEIPHESPLMEANA